MARGGIQGKKRRMIEATRSKKKKKKTNTGPSSSKRRRTTGSASTTNDMDFEQTTISKSGQSSYSNSKVSLPSAKNDHSPPWQIMNTHDHKRHVEEEIQRRRSAGSSSPPQQQQQSQQKANASKSNVLLPEATRQLLSWKRFNPQTSTGGVSFIGSYLDKRLPPPLGVPEVAFLGRSNVGKSSLLNRLLSRTSSSSSSQTTSADKKQKQKQQGKPTPDDRARVGKTPGATASVNLYAILNKSALRPILGFVDLPGFGYAKLSKSVKESVELAAERYLSKRKELALGILLVDIRRVPSEDDRAVLAALYDMGVPLIVVATKVDKLSGLHRTRALEEVRLGLGLPDGQPLCVSSVTGEGCRDLWSFLMDACETRVQEIQSDIEGLNEEDDDDEDEELAYDDGEYEEYDQGYDWVHGIGYEDDVNEQNDISYEDNHENNHEDDFDDMTQDDQPSSSFQWKELKRQARNLDRKGEL